MVGQSLTNQSKNESTLSNERKTCEHEHLETTVFNLREFLHTFSNIWVIEDINTAEINPLILQSLYYTRRESAHWHRGSSLHIKHDAIVANVVLAVCGQCCKWTIKVRAGKTESEV